MIGRSNCLWHAESGQGEVLLLGLVLLLGVGCNRTSQDVPNSELVGTYEMRTGSQLDVVDIRSDGTYEHTITHDGKTSRQTGDWTVYRDRSGLWVDLKHFDTSSWPDGLPGAGQVVSYTALVEVRGKQLALLVSSGVGFKYLKRVPR